MGHEVELLFLCHKRFEAMMNFFCSAVLVSILGVSSKSWEKCYLGVDGSLCLGDSFHICLSGVIRDLSMLEYIFTSPMIISKEKLEAFWLGRSATPNGRPLMSRQDNGIAAIGYARSRLQP